MIETLTFGQALEALKEGKTVTRNLWNAHHTLRLQQPDENSLMTRPYIYMMIGDDAADLRGDRIPWVASQTDLLAIDWFVMPEENENATA